MITVTFYAPTVLARRVQDNVKRTGGWFEANPLHMFGEKSMFMFSFNEDGNYNKFSACNEIIQQPWF